MSKILIKNADAVISCDSNDTVYRNADVLIEENRITSIGQGLDAPGARVIGAKGRYVYPGLVNTHHHLLQAFTRNIPAVQNSELFDWLMYLYNVWVQVDSEYIYLASHVSMAEFVKFGGTTMFDQQFAFPRSSGKEIVDRQFDAATELGLRFHAGRSCFTRGKSKGGLPPDELVETVDEVLRDCERLIDKYHDASAFSMKQVVCAPCSPFSVDSDIMIESARLARAKGVRLHTHLCETIDEENYCLETYGDRPLAWADKCGFTGPDVWYAHGIHFTDEEVGYLAKTQTGVSHNAVSNMKLSSGICKVPLMMKLGVPVGLAVDGCGSNDASNLLADLRVTFLLHRLNSSKDAPTAYEILKLGTKGSASLLGREDIGTLEAGKAADLFMINMDKLDTVGATLDPASYLCTVGYGNYVERTIIDGKIVYEDGRLTGVDEDSLRDRAAKKVEEVYSKLP
ncbi:MAG: amidohydrolase family protein [Clostridiales Family XIII bacterium]|jgi:cytosine/adenosine deaminase-related metal-dependent hydrolase|nr:amidohydrolase family protein [Clostridiales Family XIII bacterium]